MKSYYTLRIAAVTRAATSLLFLATTVLRRGEIRRLGSFSDPSGWPLVIPVIGGFYEASELADRPST